MRNIYINNYKETKYISDNYNKQGMLTAYLYDNVSLPIHYKVKWFEVWSRIRVDVQVNGM